ncbi:hypothetical protein P7K49_032489 [Saguinus oedipus]|uniref:Uncharacterized protein n=1 Tax=Saguinus oedipus TaxID=9490 RepID=A0ABQ9TYE0_SAGOE|nr:hypothetical protein P7K49_032489 [Saguinus oedipus]
MASSTTMLMILISPRSPGHLDTGSRDLYSVLSLLVLFSSPFPGSPFPGLLRTPQQLCLPFLQASWECVVAPPPPFTSSWSARWPRLLHSFQLGVHGGPASSIHFQLGVHGGPASSIRFQLECAVAPPPPFASSWSAQWPRLLHSLPVGVRSGPASSIHSSWVCMVVPPPPFIPAGSARWPRLLHSLPAGVRGGPASSIRFYPHVLS